MKAPKPFRSARTSPSFPEAEAAILIFLELAKKIPRICTENCTYSIPLPLIPPLYVALALIFHQQSLGRQRGDQPRSPSPSEAPRGGRDV